ncbi:hypothetical protein [Riemerella anatipestifer]|uniref:hypothetical protein n=1 Tax=Riemerella anatipestifer TaxID=34085 RepID=UPI0021AA3C64
MVDQSGQTLAVLRHHNAGCIPYEPVIKKPLLPILKKRNRRNCTRHQNGQSRRCSLFGRKYFNLDGGVPFI